MNENQWCCLDSGVLLFKGFQLHLTTWSLMVQAEQSDCRPQKSGFWSTPMTQVKSEKPSSFLHWTHRYWTTQTDISLLKCHINTSSRMSTSSCRLSIFDLLSPCQVLYTREKIMASGHWNVRSKHTKCSYVQLYLLFWKQLDPFFMQIKSECKKHIQYVVIKLLYTLYYVHTMAICTH